MPFGMRCRFTEVFDILQLQMYDVDKLGIGRVMDECTDYFRHYNGIHLSYDIDAVDPFFAPSTGERSAREMTYCSRK